jgi:arylsulfatase A-like enzyme
LPDGGSTLAKATKRDVFANRVCARLSAINALSHAEKSSRERSACYLEGMMELPSVRRAKWLDPSRRLAAAVLALGAMTRAIACASAPGQSVVDPHAASLSRPAVPEGDEGGDGGGEEMEAIQAAEEPSLGAGRDARAPEGASLASAAALSVLSDAVRARLPKPISFLFITVDTLRPDLGFMGYERAVSPQIDKLAARSIVFDKAYSISTYTGFALTPMMASRYPSEMPRTDRHEVKYLRENVLLAERLLEGGYHTAGAASHFLFDPALGWIDGFERFAKVPAEGKAPPGAGIDWFHSSRGLANAAIQLLESPEVTSGPFFIWVHFLDPHKRYLEHPGFSNWGHDPRALYDGEIAYTDYHIGRVLDALDASPLRDHTVVILTADHGEAFGEHGFNYHGKYVWDEVVRVPLVVYVPGCTPRRITRRVSAVELAPTVLDLAGLPEDDGARGQSFAPELFGGALAEHPILVDQPQNPYYPLRRAFIEGSYKLHFTSEPVAGSPDPRVTYQLFDLSRDPGEQNDLATSDAELLERMKKAYESYMSAIVEVPPRPAGGMPPAKVGAAKSVAKTAPVPAPAP